MSCVVCCQMLTFIVYLVRKSQTKRSMLEVAGLTLRHTGVIHSLGVPIVSSDTFGGRSSAVFFQRHCCVSVLQLTLWDGQKEREATRGVEMQLQEELIEREAQREAQIQCYMRHGHEAT